MPSPSVEWERHYTPPLKMDMLSWQTCYWTMVPTERLQIGKAVHQYLWLPTAEKRGGSGSSRRTKDEPCVMALEEN